MTGFTPATAGSLYTLANLLRIRWDRFKQPDDIKYHVNYLRYLRDKRLQVDISHDFITSRLVGALEEQVVSQWRSDNVMENIKEMVILCLELLNCDNLVLAIDAFAALFHVMVDHYNARREFQDQVIECFREANIRFPYSPELSFYLGRLLFLRFVKNAFANDDHNEAIASLNRAITLASDFAEDAEVYRSIIEICLRSIAAISNIRCIAFGKPEYLEEAINHHRTYLSSSWVPLDHPKRLDISRKLADLVDRRIRFTNHKSTNCFDLWTMPSLTASIPKLKFWTSEQWGRHYRALISITEAIGSGSGSEIVGNEEVLKYCRQLVDSLRRDPNSNDLLVSSLPCITLGRVLFHAFKNNDKIEYLDESIAVLRDGLKMYRTRYEQHSLSKFLIFPLYSRLDRLRRREDLEDLIQLFVKVVDDIFVTGIWRFLFSRDWAIIAHVFGHPSVTAAYEKALSLVQDYFSYPPTLETQHSRLVSMHEECTLGDLPSNYASYQVDTGQLDKAIETLEQGRALLWSEMRSFRTSADRLAAVNLALAEEFVAINSELEQVTTSIVPCGITQAEGSEGDGPGRIDPFGPLVAKRQKLLEDRDKLISRIRTLPDLDNFLKPPSFDALRSAALRGPVIIINHCTFRSDILILFHNSPPSLITTPLAFHHCALELGDRLVEDRKEYGLDSRRYNRTLRVVLEGLYGLVGRPVIDEFHKAKVPEQSRVWWCPTSVFCHLPLHAMGPIPSDDGVKRYFSDLYISSYTPTLSTLIESRKPGRQAPGRPSILLVAQPASLRHAIPEIWAVQSLDTTVTSLISKKATPCSVVEGLRHHQFSHFVCHGYLKPGKPFDTSLELHGGQRLTLLEIVRSRLPTAEFAFLAACHTAEVTEESIVDESLHLTAAMQYCGFRSVVGTMWAMADEDGQFLVEDFYKSMLSSDEPGVPYYERSAQALRDAVKNLRRKGVPLERWVNYVHYGA